MNDNDLSNKRNSLISGISIRVHTAKKFDNVLEESVRKLHEYFDADRSNLVVFTTLTGIYSIYGEYKKENVLSFEDFLDSKDGHVVKISPGIHEMLSKDCIVVDSYINERELNSYFHGKNEKDDIKSMMMVPLTANNNLWGYMAFVDTHENRQWLAEDIKMCKNISIILTDAISKGMVRDITYSKARMLNIILDNISTAVFWKDRNLNYLGCNRHYENLYEVRESEIIGKNSYDFLPRDYSDRAERVEWQMLRGQTAPKSIDHMVKNKWGHDRWIRTTRTPIINEYDEIVAIVGVSEDITTEIEYDINMTKNAKDLEYAVMQAEKANAAKTEFLSRMSHEIRTPLSAILGLIQVSLDSDDINFIKDNLIKTEASSNILYSVINDLLDLSKIEADKMSIVNNDFNLEDMLIDSFDIIIDSAEEKNLHMVIEMDYKIPEVVIGDRNHLSQVLVNLLSNAVKFTDDGGIIDLAVNLVEKKENSMNIEFVVSDTGIGMSKELINNLFDAFERSEDEGGTGTGLGLPIAQKLVNLMGGTIKVNSELGVGSDFSFTLDLGISDEYISAIDKYIQRYKDINILKVGNNSTQASTYFTDYLRTLGAEMYLEDSVESATRLLERNTIVYDILILDFSLTDIDEIQALNNFIEFYDGDKIILLTSGIDAEDKFNAAKDLGVSQILSRPLFPNKTVNAIESILHDTIEEIKTDTTPDFSGARLLLVEDIEVNREIVIHFLKETNIQIDSAENGKEAFDLYIENKGEYDLIFMDVQMPVMNGYDATIAIRNYEKDHDIYTPIYAITASAYGSDVRKCLDVGMDAHISKPFHKNQILETVARTIDNKENIKTVTTHTMDDSGNFLDLETGLGRVLNDVEFYISLLIKFVESSDIIINNISDLSVLDNTDGLLLELHTLKGLSKNLALDKLSSTAEELEVSAMNGNITDDDINKLINIYNSTVLSINDFIKNRDNVEI